MATKQKVQEDNRDSSAKKKVQEDNRDSAGEAVSRAARELAHLKQDLDAHKREAEERWTEQARAVKDLKSLDLEHLRNQVTLHTENAFRASETADYINWGLDRAAAAAPPAPPERMPGERDIGDGVQ